jgi:uncharacterized protein YoxC
MTLRSFFGKLRKKFLRLFLGYDLFLYFTGKETSRQLDDLSRKTDDSLARINNLLVRTDEFSERINGLSHKTDGTLTKVDNFSEQLNDLSHKTDDTLTKVDNFSEQGINSSLKISELKQHLNVLSNEISKTKTLLLLKEQMPELIKKFSSGFSGGKELFDNFFDTDIFYDLRNDFSSTVWQIYDHLIGAGCIHFDILQKNLPEMGKNPILKIPAFSMLANISIPNYKDDSIAYKLEQMYDPSLLNDKWSGFEYISFLLLRKEEEKAKEVLKSFLKHHDKSVITEILPIADFAYRIGITSDDIVIASELFQVIMMNVENQLLEEYVKNFGNNTTVAIVGNGPQELGTGNGVEIDSHDIVVRFNNYNESLEYKKDYGSKANIVFFTLGNPQISTQKIIKKKVDISVCNAIYAEPCIHETLQGYKTNPISNITTIEFTPVRSETQSKYGINWASTGFRAVYFFKKIMGVNLRSNDLYGFGIKKGAVQNGHYDDLSLKPINLHNLNFELSIMQDILKPDCDVSNHLTT